MSQSADPGPCDWCPLPGGCPRRWTPPACDWYLDELARSPVRGPIQPEVEVERITLAESLTRSRSPQMPAPAPAPARERTRTRTRMRTRAIDQAVNAFALARELARACAHRVLREQPGGCNCAGVCTAGKARRNDGVVSWRECYTCAEQTLLQSSSNPLEVL